MSDISSGLNSDQLLVGTARGPGIYLCDDLSAQAPQDVDTPFAAPWVPLGYASEDGPTVSSSTDTTDIRGWQSLGVLRSLITGRTVTVQFQLMQWNVQNLAIYWDIDTPTLTAGAFSFDVRSDQAGRRRQLAVDIKDGENEVRLVFPRVQLQAAGDMSFQRSSAALLDVTFSALESEGKLFHMAGKLVVPATGAAAPMSSGGSGSTPSIEPAL